MYRIDPAPGEIGSFVRLTQTNVEFLRQMQGSKAIPDSGADRARAGRHAGNNVPGAGHTATNHVPDAGRVIAGTARGLRLEAPGAETRPLGDRVKQTAFAILEPDLPGARVLDLFAGSGAAGIEALSRGASQATFVDRERSAVLAIAANLERTQFGDRGTIVKADVLAWLRGQAVGSFGIAFVDPPYSESGLLEASLVALAPHLAPGARVIAKHFWRNRPPATIGLLASERERRFGETALTFYRRQEER